MPLTRQSDRLRSRLFTTAESANPGAFTATDWALFCSISTIWGASVPAHRQSASMRSGPA